MLHGGLYKKKPLESFYEKKATPEQRNVGGFDYGSAFWVNRNERINAKDDDYETTVLRMLLKE